MQRGSRNIPLHVLMPETVIERKGYYYGSQLQGGFFYQLLAKERNFTRKQQMKNELLKDFKPVDVTYIFSKTICKNIASFGQDHMAVML